MRYSQATIDAAVDLRERGLSCKLIGERLGMTTSAVDWHCLRLGAEPPKARIQTRSTPPKTYYRNGRAVREFTPEDDHTLLAMEADGARISAIARMLHRRPNSIRNRLMVLARRDARQEAVCT